jgi:hypothetical protein
MLANVFKDASTSGILDELEMQDQGKSLSSAKKGMVKKLHV